MIINKEILYDQLRLAINVSDVGDERIRYAVIGDELDVDLNHVVYTFNLESKTPIDLMAMAHMYVYSINIVIISKSESKIAQIQEEVRTQLLTYYTDFDIKSVGDSDILKDEELGLFSSNVQFELTFN